MDAPGIAMEDRVRLDDRVASAVLYASTSNNTATSDTELDGIVQDVSGSEVRHPTF